MPSFDARYGDVLQLGTPSPGHPRAAQRMLLSCPRGPNAQNPHPLHPHRLLPSAPPRSPRLQGGCGARQGAESSSVGLCWVLGAGHRGVNLWDTSYAALSPLPSPHTHLSAGRSRPASMGDLIAAPLLKPKHICLVIIKSWGGTPRSEAQTCRYCEHQCLCRWSDRGCICLGTAWVPRPGGGWTPHPEHPCRPASSSRPIPGYPGQGDKAWGPQPGGWLSNA